MDWGKFIYLLLIILVGYLPYKLIQRIQKQGLTNISPLISIFLSAWFTLLSAILFLQSKVTYINVSQQIVIFFLVTTLAWFFAPAIVRKVGIFPKKIVDEKPKWFVIRFEPRTLYLKYFEVIFQQVKFLFLLVVVLSAMQYVDRIFWFTLIIGFFHFNNIFFLPRKEAMTFFALSFPMAILFSFMILNGLLLITTSIHLWFYLVFAGYPWFQKNHKR